MAEESILSDEEITFNIASVKFRFAHIQLLNKRYNLNQ